MNYPAIRLVFNRKNDATCEKTSLVQIEVKFEKKKKYLSTGVKLYLGQWEKDQVVNRADAYELNNQIQDLVIEIRKFINELSKEKEAFTFQKLDNFLNLTPRNFSFI
jgi:hypothetical protein